MENNTRTFEMHGGGQISGKTASEILHNLRNSSWTPEDTLEAFKADVAQRCKIYSGDDVRTDPDEAMLEDLIKAGFLNEIK
jgi:hypothetical protein